MKHSKFTKLFMVPKYTTRIGLGITKNQLEAMKRTIEVESKEGSKSIFKIYINEK
jgi:signal transduction histidine kinase